MKRNLFFFTVIIAAGLIISSCTDCKECRTVVKSNDSIVETGEWAEYCGEDLNNVEDEDSTTVGDRTTSWECRYSGL